MAVRGTVDANAGGTLVSSVTGTANEVTSSPTTGAVVLSLPTSLTFTGKTVTGGTFSGITLSGTIAGTPTFSGALTAAASLTFSVATSGIVLKRGANGLCGTFVANGVTPVTITNSNVAITDCIIISLNTGSGTVGTSAPIVASITAGVGFTTQALALDASTYNYAIIKNAA